MKKNIFTVDEILCRKKASDAPFSTKMILSDHPTIYSRPMLLAVHILRQSILLGCLRSPAAFAFSPSSLSANP